MAAEVAEKALKGKAISHGVAYGAQQIVNRHIKETVDVDGPSNPIGVFMFKYRSRSSDPRVRHECQLTMKY